MGGSVISSKTEKLPLFFWWKAEPPIRVFGGGEKRGGIRYHVENGETPPVFWWKAEFFGGEERWEGG